MRTAVMKRLGKAKEDQKGFTLIELLAVIVILAVIAAIAIPLIGGIINKSKKDADVSTARQIYDAARLYVTSELNGENPKVVTTTPTSDGKLTVKQLQTKGYLDTNITLPSTKKPLNVDDSYLQYKADGTLETITLTDTSSTAIAKTYPASEVIAVESTR
ncbi:prepilin-type N-terminal cleavage/methylation domain-containing protein [Cohnella ginsengisoli]|uniref:Prepilin-type N-terminal cleavage/methylation domain-containing protein n=1 Tax=Cohnella ginsengisoli TaxID=425004 RepID=A0A9X4KF50_9BACL|nr:prepilin-type N-terminal cleavage/methylation domain-containing protein [Cohnella ginsengisoli]MDG0790651.1 prepilin-type N-terminal cleavage/methylation domain-containing protein [Cohnella ginsengisoli]